LAHNPSLLGLFFSIVDQFFNTTHFVSGGKLIVALPEEGIKMGETPWKLSLQGGDIPSKIFCGFVNWFGHLISDVAGSSQSAKNGTRGTGIPSPFWSWTNDVIALKEKLNIPVNEMDKAVNDLAVKLFENGYDFRFQKTQTIPVRINELIVRLFYSIRRLLQYFKETPKTERSFTVMWKKCEPFSNATVKRMLTVAHGTFCLIDAGDATIRAFIAGGGTFNPTEFFLRLNLPGVGSFAISLYGETKMAFAYHNAKANVVFEERRRTILLDYVESLQVLAKQYDDAALLTFVDDFKKSDAYKAAFEKSVALARLRGVPETVILKNKAEIDQYFGGKNE